MGPPFPTKKIRTFFMSPIQIHEMIHLLSLFVALIIIIIIIIIITQVISTARSHQQGCAHCALQYHVKLTKYTHKKCKTQPQKYCML